MEDLSEGTIRKIERFKKLGFQVEVKWEWEFKQAAGHKLRDESLC